jgi:Ice-binding-like
VDLGSAASYAVLSGGAYTGGTSTLTGDLGAIGADTAGTTTFTCGSDQTTAAPNTAVTIAMGDFNTAYANAWLATPTTSGMAALDGLTLTAGVYAGTDLSLGSDTTLMLDGGGNPNAVFIFQSTGTLTLSAGCSVFLENQASAQNVFWAVSDVVTLDAGSAFQGTILAQGAITMVGSAVVVDGRLLTAGAVNLVNNTITVNDCGSDFLTPSPTPSPTP